jgi:pSer/pThr/pTyr-binding forkhead associated (FHA) protein
VRATVGFSGSRKIVLDRGDRLVVGRSPDSPVADLCSDNISRLHAEIYVSEKGAFVLDVGSTNGTFVEGERLAARSPWLVTSTAAVAFGADPPLRLTIEVEEVE